MKKGECVSVGSHNSITSQSELSNYTWNRSSNPSDIMRGRVCFFILFIALGKRNLSASGHMDLSNHIKSLGTVTVYDGPLLSGVARKSVLRVVNATYCSSSKWTTMVVSFFVYVIDADTVSAEDSLLRLRSISASAWLSKLPLGCDCDDPVKERLVTKINFPDNIIP